MGDEVGRQEEKSMKKKYFQEGYGNSSDFFSGSLQLTSKWEALEMSL